MKKKLTNMETPEVLNNESASLFFHTETIPLNLYFYEI